MNRNRKFEYDWRRRKIALRHDEFLFEWKRSEFVCENRWSWFHVCEANENENENERIIDAFAIKRLFRVFSCKLIFVSFLCIKLFIFIRKTKFSSHFETKMCWKKNSRRISKRRCVEKKWFSFRSSECDLMNVSKCSIFVHFFARRTTSFYFILFIIKCSTKFQHFSNVRWRRTRFEL
jgi:hypothetical protein